MFQNYFRIALRNLLKNKYATFMNLAGLVVGMSSALLIWQYVAFENSYDRFNKNAGRIVRVRTDRYPQGILSMQFAAGAACAGPLLKENFSEVEDFVKVRPTLDRVVVNGDLAFREKEVAFASAPFFSIFSYPLLQGDPKNCLAEPWTACLSASAAKKYFGAENPVGKTIKVNTGNSALDSYTITGVFEDMPENSHQKWDVLLSYITYSTIKIPDGRAETNAFWDGYLSYLLLKPGVDPQALEQKIPALISQKFGDRMRQYNDSLSFALQPLTGIHLNSHYLFETEPNGDANAVRFLLLIGSLVLIIAWFNYVNLSTARAETRAKEVGVRKVVGSGRGSLVLQFLTEAALLNVGAMCISLALALGAMPLFERLAGKTIPFTLFSDPKLWLTMLGIFLLGTVLAGLYPAFVLSSFKPAGMLKGATAKGAGAGVSLRKILVVGQFTASVALIVGTIVVFRQLSYMREADLGLHIEQTLVVKAPAVVDSTYREKFKTFKQELRHIEAVRSITGSTAVPGAPFGWTAGGVRRWGAPETQSEGVQAMAADFDFVPAYGMQLAAGRSISEAMASDSMACLLNEAAVDELHLGSPAEAVGVDINFWGDRVKIVGVLKNFHQESPKLAFEPLVMRVLDQNSPPKFFSVKLKTNQLPQTLDALQAKWGALFPGNPFDFFFLDEQFEKQYTADQRFGRVFGLFALLAIFVSCLGLFALATFVAQRRTKEIGIRKVLGASVGNLVGLLSADFLLLVGIAILIASPMAYYFMNRWLQDFAYRIDIQWWVFVLAGMVSVAIAFLTVSFQSVRAALANPVQSLRNE